MKKTLTIITLLLACTLLRAQEDGLNCFGIIAGKEATADGSVIFGHNEDDGGEQMLNMNIFKGDGQRAGMIWAEFPGMSVADAFMNEFGVCIASDGCPSREDRKDYTDGGILFDVRMDVAREAHSAREAVAIIGRDVEKYGYRGSGRTYLVADPEEGWLVSVVQGRHWVAQRVPDDKVVTIPNYYMIGEVDLSDTTNFAGSDDLIDYAVSRGWYDPAEGPFNFRLAYASPATFDRKGNGTRHIACLDFFTNGEYDYDVNTVEFAITPAFEVTPKDVMNALSIHSEDHEDGTHPVEICTNVTILSTVFQLRADMPREVGCLMWAAAGHPCSEPFIPWYLGMGKTVPGFQRFDTFEEAYDKHFSDAQDKRENHPDGLYWQFVDRWNDINTTEYSTKIVDRIAANAKLQAKIFARQQAFEARLVRISKKNPQRASRMMERYTTRLYRRLLR